MCGRFALFTSPTLLADYFDAQVAPAASNVQAPLWNIGPTSPILGLAEDRAHGRVLARYRWGLIPRQTREPLGPLFNARCETVAKKPSFRDAFAKRRMVVPADGFYEWRKTPTGARDPFYFGRADGSPLAFAGLWEPPVPTRDGEPALPSCTIVTAPASPDVADVHDRMPVVLDPADLGRWLDADGPDAGEVADLCRPAPQGTLVRHRVDRRVGNTRNDDALLVARVGGPGT
jgi:putative SOS response-associated peptidase YedK